MFIGEWWLPGNSDNKFGGVLSVTENKKFELMLIGDFQSENWREDLIYGNATKTTENKQNYFILHTNHKVQSSYLGFSKSKYLVHKFLKTSISKGVFQHRFLNCNLKSNNYSKIHSISNRKVKPDPDGSL